MIFASCISFSIGFFLCKLFYKQPKKEKAEEYDKENEDIKRRNEGLQNIMDYDVNVAYGGGENGRY